MSSESKPWTPERMENATPKGKVTESTGGVVHSKNYRESHQAELESTNDLKQFLYQSIGRLFFEQLNKKGE